jgi:heptosyltransferase-1
MSAMGDIIHALPVLDYLKQASPGIEIDWVVEEPFRELLEGNPLVSRLHTVRTKVWRRRPFAAATRREIGALKETLRSRDYRMVFDIQGNLKSGLVDWLTNAPSILGFTKDILQESINTIFTTRQVPVRMTDYHITDQYLRLVSVPFGADFKGMALHTDIPTAPEDDTAAETLLATLGDGLVFLFHYGTTWQTKFWSEEGWIALGRAVRELYPDSTMLFSWGNEAERLVVNRLAESIGTGSRVIDRYPLGGLTSLLKRVDLVVGGDTGPVHIAAAVGTPTVSLYRSSDGLRSGPRGPQHAIIQTRMDCASCFRTKCDKDRECRAGITPDMVLQGIERVLGKGSSHGI